MSRFTSGESQPGTQFVQGVTPSIPFDLVFKEQGMGTACSTTKQNGKAKCPGTVAQVIASQDKGQSHECQGKASQRTLGQGQRQVSAMARTDKAREGRAERLPCLCF